VSRVAPLVLVALFVAGCGGSKPVAAPLPAAPKAKHVRIVAKKKFVRRVNGICASMERPVGAILASMPTATSDVGRNRRVFGDWFGRAHRVFRHARRRMVRLGLPSRDRQRWDRVMSKWQAVEGHLDTMRAAAWAGSVPMLRLDARELMASGDSLDRRFRRFGAKRCARS
jgi:hypothetical protein